MYINIGLLEKMAIKYSKIDRLLKEMEDINRQIEAASRLAEKYYYEEKDEEKAEFYKEKIQDLVARSIELHKEALALVEK